MAIELRLLVGSSLPMEELELIGDSDELLCNQEIMLMMTMRTIARLRVSLKVEWKLLELGLQLEVEENVEELTGLDLEVEVEEEEEEELPE